MVILRSANDVDREVRIIRALYSQECLHPHAQIVDPVPDTRSRKAPRRYQNTGVQTLPPPNGKIHTLIYGREPTQADIRHNMGLAAIGRYERDPRSNPFELMYGAAYPARSTADRANYVDSGFQTANTDANKMALARAKFTASMTAKRYRGAAAQVGYIINAESKDEMIVHSEQYDTTARFDREGNVSDGCVHGRYLPNIHGRLINSEISAPALGQKISEHTSTETPFPEKSTIPSKLLQPPAIRPQTTFNDPVQSTRKTCTVASWSDKRMHDSRAVHHDEYGRDSSDVYKFVIHGDIADVATTIPRHPRPAMFPTSRSTKKRSHDDQHTGSPSKRQKVAVPEALHNLNSLVTPLPNSPTQPSPQGRGTSAVLPGAQVVISTQSLQRSRLRRKRASSPTTSYSGASGSDSQTIKSELRAAEKRNGSAAKTGFEAMRNDSFRHRDDGINRNRGVSNNKQWDTAVKVDSKARLVPDRSEQKAATRATRKPRQPFVPYVPPAMRLIQGKER